jgi:SAM-dependent methyltransferase
MPGCSCKDHAPTCHLGKVSYHPSACDCPSSFKTVPATVLDVFHGSGTTGAVAEYLGRRYIGIELNPEYVDLYDARCAEVRRSIIGGDSPDREAPADGQMGLFS